MNCEAPAITSTLMPRVCASVQPASLASTPKIMPKGTTTIRNGRLSRAPCQKALRVERSGIGAVPGAGAGLSCRPMAVQPAIPGLILAGGGARRMGGGDKALLPLAGRPLLAHVLDRLTPQLGPLALSANGDRNRFAAFGLPVLADDEPAGAGPLAGLLAGLDWAATLGAAELVTAAVDTPFLPRDLVARLRAAAGPAGIAIAAAPGGAGPERHPTAGLWPVALRATLRADLAAGERRLGAWAAALGCALASFPDPDAFFNVNTPADLARAEAMLAA